MESLALQRAELQMGKESTIRRVKGAFQDCTILKQQQR